MILPKKYNIIENGILFLGVFFLLTLISSLINGSNILLMLYSPGIFFGLSIFFSFKNSINNKHILLLTILIIITYFLILLIPSKNYQEFIILRQRIYGSVGAIIVLFLINSLSEIKFKWTDYLLAFLIGLISTYNTLYEKFNINFIYFGIIIWQIGLLTIINRRKIIQTIATKNSNI